jgi:hypothetical protein
MVGKFDDIFGSNVLGVWHAAEQWLAVSTGSPCQVGRRELDGARRYGCSGVGA